MNTADEPEHFADDEAGAKRTPLVVEDLLLLLYQPGSRTIAGENVLFYVLGAAVLADLALDERISVADARFSTTVSALGDSIPSDPILEPAWAYVAKQPRDAQTVLAAVGPSLRAPVLDRLIERGHLREEAHKTLGLFPTTRLVLASDRRDALIARVKDVLLEGREPDAPTAAIIALLSASGTLPQFDSEIPWGSRVYTRSKQFEQGDWGATAASAAVTRTMTAVVTNAVIAATVLPRA